MNTIPHPGKPQPRSITCKRCGDEGHQPKTCPMPPLGRPDIERMTQHLRAGLTKRVAGEQVQKLLVYIERLEASRRQAIAELQRRMEATHNTGIEA